MKKSIYKKYEQLKEMYDEASGVLADYYDILRENYYLHEFVHYKSLETEYQRFKECSFKISDEEDPFPHLTIK